MEGRLLVRGCESALCRRVARRGETWRAAVGAAVPGSVTGVGQHSGWPLGQSARSVRQGFYAGERIEGQVSGGGQPLRAARAARDKDVPVGAGGPTSSPGRCRVEDVGPGQQLVDASPTLFRVRARRGRAHTDVRRQVHEVVLEFPLAGMTFSAISVRRVRYSTDLIFTGPLWICRCIESDSVLSAFFRSACPMVLLGGARPPFRCDERHAAHPSAPTDLGHACFRAFFTSVTSSTPAALSSAMSLKPQIARHRSSSARNALRKWVRLSAPP